MKADNYSVGDVRPEVADFFSVQADELERARRRLMDGALYSEALASHLSSRRRHFPRSVTIALMSTTTVALELVVLHSYFGGSGLG